MALSIRRVKSYVIGDRRETIADITFDSSYRTGGLALTAAGLGLRSIDALVAETGTRGHTFALDRTNNKLMAFAGGTQISDATDLSAVVARVVVHGMGQAI